MIKHTPQEIADFFGCYVAKRNNLSLWTLYSEKPALKGGGWEAPSFTIKGDLHSSLVNVPADHDWMHLYEPNPDNKSDGCYADKADSDNKPNRLGEVYTHKEYVLLCEFQPGPLMQKVNELLQDGFRLYGNPWTGPDSNYGYIHYQAMVRGV